MIITPNPTRRRPPLHRVRPSVPPETLVLTAAAYDFAGHVLTLTFDRPVNIAAGVNVSAIVVDDSDTGNRYRGSAPATLSGPSAVQLTLALVGPVSVPNTFLTAGPNTGIAAANDGGTWAGVSGKQVPFA
jgi:hypothetical protein